MTDGKLNERLSSFKDQWTVDNTMPLSPQCLHAKLVDSKSLATGALGLFDNDGNVNDDDISKIEIDKEFAKRYEYNKKREALQRYEELLKKGLIDESESESESESSDEEEDETDVKKEDIQFFENLLKVKNRDPSLYSNVKLFESDSETDCNDKEKESRGGNEKGKKKKPMYLKDVMAKHLIEEGPEFDGEKGSKREEKSYSEEQEELRKAFLDAVEDAEEDKEEFLKVKERKYDEVSGDGDAVGDDVEFEKKLGDYFGGEGELDEGSMFLRDFFKNKMWLDKNKKGGVGEDEVDELLRDEEEVVRQEKYEESYNFRYEENVGDRVLGHSRKVEGSVRKKDNSRKEQRKNKEERMKIAEMERKEELKHLKNLKKKEMKEKMKKVMDVAGFKDDDDDFPLDLDDFEDEFDPDEYDRMMKKAFDEKYYDAEDMEPGFGSDDGEMEKPDFDKEDELLGLPKDWDMVDSGDGFLAARERSLKLKQQNGDDCYEKGGSGEERNEESKRKRKRKASLVQKVKEEMMEEYYKLDYEGTVGDLKTRFKYAKVDPNRYGLKTEEVLEMNDKELNQYVSIKKLAPYMDKEWKVPSNKKHQQKMIIKERLQGKYHKNSSKDNKDKTTSVLGSKQDGTEKLDESNVDTGLSRKAKRRCHQAELKLSRPRLIAYGKVQS